MKAVACDFSSLLAAHGFLLETQDHRSRTYQQADGNLTATWDLRDGGIYIWHDKGQEEGRSIVSYV